MHDYAVIGHSRTVIGRWLGLLAIVCAGAMSSALTMLEQVTGIAMIGGVTITVSALFAGLYWAFNKWGWKLLSVGGYPKIGGLWTVKGKTQDENGQIRFEWEAVLDIQQMYETISVSLRTRQSTSQSDTASLTKVPGNNGGWRLSYGYQNTPKSGEFHELNAHRGFCEITFDEGLKTATAQYFNNNGRRTFGVMDLERKK